MQQLITCQLQPYEQQIAELTESQRQKDILINNLQLLVADLQDQLSLYQQKQASLDQ